jgi:hypothetical protein
MIAPDSRRAVSGRRIANGLAEGCGLLHVVSTVCTRTIPRLHDDLSTFTFTGVTVMDDAPMRKCALCMLAACVPRAVPKRALRPDVLLFTPVLQALTAGEQSSAATATGRRRYAARQHDAGFG